MVDKPKRVAVIGFDCPVVPLVEQYVKEGYLPNFKRVIEGGVIAEQCLVPYPTITPPNWSTIATGALIGTHQVTDFWMLEKGQTPDSDHMFAAHNSGLVQAETLWEAVVKAGGKAVVVNFPTSWPPKIKNGIQVGGASLTPGEHWNTVKGHIDYACDNQLITTGIYPGVPRSKFEAAAGWANLDEPGEDPLEMAVPLAFHNAAEPLQPTTWYVLVRQSGDQGYDTATLSPSKDLKDAFFTLRLKEWSPKTWTKVTTAGGQVKDVCFKAKLMDLSPDAEDFRIYLTGLADLSALCYPPDVYQKWVDGEGVPVPEGGGLDAQMGMIEEDTFAETSNIYAQYIADVATSVLKDGDFSCFFMHSHPPDFTYHYLASKLEPTINKDEKSRQIAWDAHLEMYKGQDKMLGQILDVLPADTLVVLVSDHGAVPDGPTFNPFDALVAGDLATMSSGKGAEPSNQFERILASLGMWVPPYDPWQSKAIPSGSCYVNVNLKGRDPEGIVDPADYEKTQLAIIDALLTYVDPETGKRPVALALTKQDARILGLYGDNISDVVYAVYPWFSSQHGQMLPTAKWGIGDLRGLWVFNGPGIKKGVRLTRTVGLQDLVPTICYATGLPLPKDVDGAVVFQVFEEPNFKQKEVAELSEALAKMEAALSGKQEAVSPQPGAGERLRPERSPSQFEC